MLFLLLAAVLFALLIGALAFVTAPVGLGLAAAIGLWLAAYAVRSLYRGRGRTHGPRPGSASATSGLAAAVEVASVAAVGTVGAAHRV